MASDSGIESSMKTKSPTKTAMPKRKMTLVEAQKIVDEFEAKYPDTGEDVLVPMNEFIAYVNALASTA